ncbi:hypothetical protein LTR09_008047 [Extremus antarcticus]|uniref:Uncharacterized protein n=1 Tax=Extremus antarcticus TaxID=702011 RepID=A0AAJ0DBC3_9PEZI|nr:hypothetical protein LTR09_008047 [Extremus antarcticus]
MAAAFSEIVTLAYDSVDEPTDAIRNIISGSVQEHATELFNGEEHTGFREAAINAPQLLLEHAKKAAASTQDGATPTPANVQWYKCPGPYCKQYSVVFSVSKETKPDFKISCPLRCTYNKKMEFWEKQKA